MAIKFEIFENYCEFCGDAFKTPSKFAKTCPASVCKRKRAEKTRKEKAGKYERVGKKDLTCKQCGKEFKGNSNRVFCSKECSNEWYGVGKLQGKKKCVVCKQPFTPRSINQIYCKADACQAEKERISKAMASTYRDKYRPPKGKKIVNKQCPVCDKIFEGRPQRKYCSSECRDHRKLPSKGSIGSKQECKHCGKEFVKSSGNQRYCSDGCAEEVLKKLAKRVPCVVCHTKFKPSINEDKYCGRRYCIQEKFRKARQSS